MTIRELKEALEGLPQLPSDTVVAFEAKNGALYELCYLDYEKEYEVVVIHTGEELDI